jgi:hypothetical protein
MDLRECDDDDWVYLILRTGFRWQAEVVMNCRFEIRGSHGCKNVIVVLQGWSWG